METRGTVLILLSLVAVASGCAHSGGGETLTEGPESVVIQELSVEPRQIFTDQPVRVSLTAANAGNVPADVMVGDQGGDILEDHCTDIFEIQEYSATSSRERSTQDSYRLNPGEVVNTRWTLQQRGSVPIQGKRCNLDFAVPFNYSVDAYRQIQIKQSRDVEGSPGLESKSSSGPMTMVVEPLQGSTGRSDTFVLSENGDRRINVMIQMINQRPDEEYRKGLVDVNKESFYVKGTEPLQLNEKWVDGSWETSGYDEQRCEMPDAQITLAQNRRSVIINCEIPLDEEIDAPSVISEITAGVNYTYVKDAGQVRVEVKPRG